MRYIFVIVFILSLAGGEASGEPHVELYTMGPGGHLFTNFGHAAICIVSIESAGGGLCYNYGTADFSNPIALGRDVVLGRAKFWVSVSDLVSMLLSFEAQDRTIYRQRLPLSENQVLDLSKSLALGATAKNREYTYSHFLNNCSTKPRDLIDEVTGGVLRRSGVSSKLTYRDFARKGFAGTHTGLVAAGDLVLGRWVDQNIDLFQAMFIPSVLRNSIHAQFGEPPEIVYQRQAPLAVEDVDAALKLFWLLMLVLTCFVWAWSATKKLAIVLSVLAACIVWLGAAISPWPELQINELLLVFVPTDVILLLGFKTRTYVRIRLFILIGVVTFKLAGVFIQPLWPFLLFMISIFVSHCWKVERKLAMSQPESG